MEKKNMVNRAGLKAYASPLKLSAASRRFLQANNKHECLTLMIILLNLEKMPEPNVTSMITFLFTHRTKRML